MLNRIANLKIEGCGLVFSDLSVMRAIILTASSMLVDAKQMSKVKEKNCKGMILTNFERSFIGGVGGVVFDVSLESNFGSTSMKFILFRPMTREELEDCTFFMCAEEEFDALNEVVTQSIQEAMSAVH